ncbi:MAG TPA: TolC family protein [Bryobacteraceae bacterium]|nr:TolC family protein [Bryobacteraceae bacterium]
MQRSRAAPRSRLQVDISPLRRGEGHPLPPVERYPLQAILLFLTKLHYEFVTAKQIAGFLLFAAFLPAQTPMTLEQAIQEALANNLDLAAQKYNVSVAEARQITASLRPNPILSVSGQTLNLLGARYTPDSPLGPNQLVVHTDFPIERGHKRQERTAVAKEEKSMAELGVREMMRQVIFGIQNAFVDIQQAGENLKLAQENLQKLEGVVSINETRLKSGDLSRVELERSQVAALQLRANVQQAQLQLDQAKTQLQLLLGRKQSTAEISVSEVLRRDDLTQTRDQLTDLAFTRRPDYLLAQQAQSRSRADLRLQIANGKVDYTVGADYNYQRAYAFGGSSLGVSFSMPLPVFNRNQGEILRARREIEQGGARTDAVRIGITNELEKAYRQYTVAKQLLNGIETGILTKARNVRDTTEYSYRRGEASLIEFLDAQRAFNDAMQTFNDARASYARSLYLLDTVSGATVSGS